MYYEKLTESRRRFVDQLIPLVESTFDRSTDEGERIKTISIDASWGMGKTLLKDVLVEKLKEKKIKVKAINAWETDYFSDPMKSLIGEMNESDLNVSSETIEKGEKLIKKMSGVAIKIFGTALLKKLNFTNEDIINLKSIFQGMDSSGIEEYKNYKDLVKNFKRSFGIGFGTLKRVIILDELDRCKPNYAIELLEATKHIFDIYNLTFIFLVNKEQLKYTVENLYGCSRENEDYFEKFFDLQLVFPEIDIEDFVKIEYKNYEYGSESFQQGGILDFEKFMTSLLLKLIIINYKNLDIKSIRQLKKSLNKFNYSIRTFSLKEKSCIFTVLGFVAYFINSEYNLKDKKNNEKLIYKFNVRKILDEFLLSSNEGDGLIVNSKNLINLNKRYNEESLFSIREVEKFYDIILETGTVTIESFSEGDGNRKLRYISDIYGNVLKTSNNRFHLLLPVTKEYVEKYGSNSLAQWCKEKYEFTHYIEN